MHLEVVWANFHCSSVLISIRTNIVLQRSIWNIPMRNLKMKQLDVILAVNISNATFSSVLQSQLYKKKTWTIFSSHWKPFFFYFRFNLAVCCKICHTLISFQSTKWDQIPSQPNIHSRRQDMECMQEFLFRFQLQRCEPPSKWQLYLLEENTINVDKHTFSLKWQRFLVLYCCWCAEQCQNCCNAIKFITNRPQCRTNKLIFCFFLFLLQHLFFILLLAIKL